MEIIKAYYKVLNKHKIMMLVYLGVFFGFFIISAMVYLNKNSHNQVNVSVVYEGDRDVEAEAKEIKKFLKDRYNIVYIKNSNEAINLGLLSGNTDYVLKVTDKNISYYALRYSENTYELTEAINEYLSYKNTLKDYIKNNSNALLSKTLNLKSDVVYKSKEKDKSSSFLYYLFNYQSYVLAAILMMAGFQLENKFYKGKAFNRIAISGRSSVYINTFLTIGLISFALFVWAIINLISYILLFGNINYTLNYVYSLVGSLFYLIAILALSLFIGAISINGEMNMAIVNILTMFLSFISGVFVPLEFLPKTVTKLAQISPMYFANLIYINISNNRFLSKSTATYLAIELLFGISFLLLTLIVHKNKKSV